MKKIVNIMLLCAAMLVAACNGGGSSTTQEGESGSNGTDEETPTVDNGNEQNSQPNGPNGQSSNIDFVIKPTDSQLSKKMGNNLSRLFSELNMAYDGKRLPNLSGMPMTEDAKKDVLSIWEHARIMTSKQKYVLDALNLPKYLDAKQVRGINVYLNPIDGSGRASHELFCDFDASGTITSVQICIEQNRYNNVFEVGMTVSEIEKRTMILHYVEQYRTAYEKKDIDFLEKIFSDDALIIIGHVTNTIKDGRTIKNIELTTKSKQEYLSKLREVFRTSSRIILRFDDVTIVQHPNPKYPHVYGVKLIQHWNSGNYHDDGNLFLLWDFTDEDRPVIHVRAWTDLKSGHVFSIDDFDMGE